MSLDTILPYIPLLALMYVIFAFTQARRRQRQSFGTLLIAAAAIIIPTVAYLLASDFAARQSMTGTLALSAMIIFITSIILRFYERRRRNPPSVYGIIGVAISFAMALALLILPSTQITPSDFASFGANGNLVNIAAVTPNALNQSADQTTGGKMAVAQALMEQTGLSIGDLTAEISSGSTIIELVESNDGNISIVIDAIAAALDAEQSQEGMPAQMFSRIGSDSTDIATKLANGQLTEPFQSLMATMLIAGEPPQGAAGGFILLDGGNFALPSNNEFPSPTDRVALNQAQLTPMPTSTDIPTLAPSELVERPTQITFPTITPTPEVMTTEEAPASTDSDATRVSNATCSLIIDYNLNLRDKPTMEGSTVLLSIPYGTIVTTTGRTADHWYHVTYDGRTGWVSGDYVTTEAACNQLQTLYN